MKLDKILFQNIYYKSVEISLIICAIIVAGMSYLFVIGYMDIPLGLVLGTLVSSLFFVINGLFVKNETSRHSAKITMCIFWARLVILAGVMVLISVLYYIYNIHVFNIFSFVGGYVLSVLIFILVVLVEGRKNDSRG